MELKMVQVAINIPQIAYDAIYACKDIEKDNTDIGELGNILLSAVEKGIVLPEHIRISKEKDNICLDVKYDDLEEG